jgi:hypothetical protein
MTDLALARRCDTDVTGECTRQLYKEQLSARWGFDGVMQTVHRS